MSDECLNDCTPLPKGIRGPRGFMGLIGLTGEKGDIGLTGPQGPSGVTGGPGIQGDIGPQGPQGPQGDTGSAGNPGLPGSDGTDGTDGLQGIQGIQGDKGDKGDNGDNGNSVLVQANGALGSCGGYDVKTISGITGGVIANSPLYNGCNGKSGRGVAVFVQTATPTNANIAANYSGINGFSAPDYIVAGAYDASQLRAGDIWIKP